MVLYIWLEFQVFDLSNEQREGVGSHYCKNLYEYDGLRMTSTFHRKQYIPRKGETPWVVLKLIPQVTGVKTGDHCTFMKIGDTLL